MEKCVCFRTFSIFLDQKLNSIWSLLRSGENCKGGSASRSLGKARYLQLVRNISWNFGSIIFVSFRSRHNVKLLLRLGNKFCRLFNIKRRLSVFYKLLNYFSRLLKPIGDITTVETICRFFKC